MAKVESRVDICVRIREITEMLEELAQAKKSVLEEYRLLTKKSESLEVEKQLLHYKL